MPTSPQALKQLARQQARDILAVSQSFHAMDRPEQLALYKDIVQGQYAELARQAGYDGVQPPQPGGVSEALARGPQRASDLIDDERHLNQRIDQAGDLGADFIQDLDFPEFVGDLLKAVFDANLNVTLEQMNAYIDLFKAATASLSKFIREIDNTAAFGHLVEKNPDEFSLDFDDEDGGGQPALTDKEGNKLDLGDNEVKAKIMDAKIAMAKEHRYMLRESLLMGITRLVVEKGVVNAAVVFDIKAKERIAKKDKAGLRRSRSTTRHKGGSFFGFYSGGRTTTTSRSQISVSSAKSTAATDLTAKITGSVKIEFKSDYFKLDNFAQLFGNIEQDQGQGGDQKKAAAGAKG